MANKIYNIDSFNRPPRLQDNLRPVEIDIPAPPVKPDETARNLLMALLPMSSFLVMGLFYALVFSRGSGGLGWLYAIPMLFIAAFTFAISYITFGEQKYEQKQKWLKQLRDYHRLLDKKEARLLAARELQENLLIKKFNSPRRLLQRVKDMEISIWERRKEDPDFLTLRIGMGEISSSINIKPPDPDLNSPDIRRAFGMFVEYKKIPNVPVAIDLQKAGSMALVGTRSLTLPLMRALMAQLSILNSPDDVHLYLFSSEAYYQTWSWMRWLPHTSNDHIGGRPSFLAFTKKRSKELLASLAKLLDHTRQVSDQSKSIQSKLSNNAVLFFDNDSGVRDEATFWDFVKIGKDWGIFSIFMCEKMEDVPSDCGSVIQINGDAPATAKISFWSTGIDGLKISGSPDRLAHVEMDNLSHRLLPVVIRSVSRNSQIPTRVNFMQLHEATAIEDLHIADRWMKIPLDDGLLPFRVRLGSENYKDPLTVNLSENNDGPHGLIAGTTGSGKSELLQTLVSSLALEHHPYFLNFMFIDFKGASTFGVFEELPHTVGLISNLDKPSAGRALEALHTENLRRQNILREHKFKEIKDYHISLLADQTILDPDTDPLPHLFIVVDEFAEMASEMPEFLDRLTQIARVGRSLGIHLILATQRPANVVKDEMRANLNFRICLRVQSIDDSRDMLRRPDAALLPHDLPGRAYFQLGDAGTLRQFQVARVGTEYKVLSPDVQRYDLYRIEYEEEILIEDGHQTEKQNLKEVTTITKALVAYLASHYKTLPHKRMKPLLLPPLEEKIEIQSICGNIKNKVGWERWRDATWEKTSSSENSKTPVSAAFRVPVGLLDDLATQSQPLYYINFLEKGGHVMAIGGSQSGKTSFLQSLCYSLITYHNPTQVNLYALSFSGKDLNVLEGLPHVGAVIDGSDTERLRRLLRYLQNEMEIRKNIFGEQGARDLAHYNDLMPQDKQMPYICVFIDGFGSLRSLEYNNELETIEKLLKWRMYGLHFIITGLQFSDIPSRLTNLIQHRIAFDLIDRSEYMLMVGRPDTLDFGVLPAGRCFVNTKTPPMRCQIGLPPSQKQWIELKNLMIGYWGERNKPIRVEILPSSKPLSEMLVKAQPKDEDVQSLLGIDGDNLLPYLFDWKKFPHLLIGGPPQSGRTSLLQSAVLGLAWNYSPEDLNFVLVDGSNSLERLNTLPHVIDRVTEEEGFIENIANMLSELDYRRKSRHQINNSPHIFIVIDDYDLMCEAFINEAILAKLGKHVRQDSGLGFHLLISVLPENVTRTTDPLMKQFRLSKYGISLSNVEMYEDLGGRPTQSMRNEDFKEGRGYVFDRTFAKLVQFAAPDDRSFGIVLTKWNRNAKATWKRTASQDKIDEVRSYSEPIVKTTEAGSSFSSQYGNLIDFNKSVEHYLQQKQSEKQKKGK